MTEMLSLSQLGTLRNGMNYDRSSAVTGCKIISVADFGDRVFPDYTALQEIDSSIVSNDDLLHDGDILFVRSNGNKNLVGRSMFIKDICEPVCYSGFCIMLRPKSDIVLPQYLFYALRSPFCRKQYSYSQQTNITNLSQSVLGSVIVPIPDYEEQVKIARILYNIDKKIENNNSAFSELETMAKTLYDYWFTQFDFPNAEGKPYRSSGGEMIWNEQLKREIPKGWECSPISSVCDVISGYPFQSSSYSESGKYRLITIKNVQDSGINLDVDNFINNLPDNLPDYCVLSPGDILMSLTGNVGRVGLMYADNCLLNQRVALLRPSKDILKGFVYILFKSKTLRMIMENLSTGTSQKNLSPIDTGKVLITYNDYTVKRFCHTVNPIIDKITMLESENDELIKLRDWLLPMLMNGQARVK